MSARNAILCPILISFVLCICDLLGTMYASSMDLAPSIVMGVFLSYFSATLIVSIAWSVVGQYVMAIRAGLDNSKTIRLLVCFLIYCAFYIVYLAQNKPENFLLWFLMGITICIAVVFWWSLEQGVRKFKIRASG